MALYDKQSLTLDRESKPRRIFGQVRERLASISRGGEDQDARLGDRKAAPSAGNEAETVEGHLVLRFPLARRGYDPVAVDEYVADLERELAALDRELAELRGHSAPMEEVESQIKRVGEQTSAVLMAAHEQREEILRTARDEAERCVSDATATARTVTEQSEARLHELEAQNGAARAERVRLLADIRTISTRLAAVADSAESGS
jgi:DivIVA domain-containing protein